MKALKEWAVTIEAMGRGQQIVTLRKGGIREPGNYFDLESKSFLLYPTFDHQRTELLKTQDRELLESALAHGSWTDRPSFGEVYEQDGEIPQPNSVALQYIAEVAQELEIDSATALNALSPFHIWSDNYAESRLRWQQDQPLTLLLLRVFQLDRPLNLAVKPEYLGCSSWVELGRETEPGGRSPVVPDTQFNQLQDQVEGALNQVTAA